jgi:molecular chaperone DnaJ
MVISQLNWRCLLENLYNILVVSPTATTEEIKKAYRSLAMRHHPDRNLHPGAENRFNSIKTAYELLSDPIKRAEYNQSLNNRIVTDPDKEARALWHTLFSRCGVVVPDDDDLTY